jgi:hypothetical protein
VDTGVDVDHPDLFGKVTDTESFVAPRGGDVSDSHGHGTHVTGTIAAFHWNAEGIAGVAPDATIMALRALSAPGSGRDSEIAEAFRYAGQRGVRIVNASLGGPGASQTLRDAIKAYPATLFVVGAGNGDQETGDDNDAKPIYPCNTPEPNVLCVGASTPTDSVATWSNFGSRSVDVFAPGESIRSTLPTLPGAATGVYGWKDGTSMATPHVAATAGLVLQAAPGLTAKQLKEVLLASADVKPGFERSVSGARLDAEAAVNLALARTALPDADRDGWTDAADACPGGPADDTYDGCVSDHDWDGVSDAIDNCDLTPTADQTDSDGDGRGNACDSTPRGHNNDGDHLWQIDDACPDDYGTLSNGCPAPPPPTQPTPQPAPPAPPDSDRDGRYDGSDACALEYAITNDGCPLPQVASLTAKVRKRGSTRSVTVAVGTTRLAILRVTIERRKGGRWVRVTRQKLVTVGNRATVTGRRVAAGRYRVRVSISTSAGTGGLVTKGFRVR